MEPKLTKTPFDEWIDKQIKYQKNNKGKYLHFDRFIKLVDRNGKYNLKKIESLRFYFQNAISNIPKHSFYPFIKSDIESPRIKHVADPRTGKKKPVLDKKIRPIAYAGHFDALIYSWYSFILNEKYQSQLAEWEIEDCVLAYLQKDKECNIHFAHEVFGFISQQLTITGECVALAFDLSSYFDNVDHIILKKQWCKVLGKDSLPKDHFKLYQMLTKYSFIQKEYLDMRFPRSMDRYIHHERICRPEQFREMVRNGQVIETNPFINTIENSNRIGEMCGIPQGSPLSACLSNIYLIAFDQLINSFAKKKQALYRRYSDDLLIICSVKDANFFHSLITRSIKRCEVVVNEKKTERINFKKANDVVVSTNQKGVNKHLQYLGFEFDGVNTYIRSSSMSRYHRRLCSKAFQAIEDAYDPEFSNGQKIHRKKLYNKFTHLGKRNFIRYGIKAMKIMEESKTIKKQIKGSIEKVEGLLSIYREEKESKLKNKKSSPKRME